MRSPALPGRRGVLLTLVILAIAGLFGHICALPAGAEWPAGAVEHHTPTERHSGHGAHIGACDANVAKAAPAAPQAPDTPGFALSVFAPDPAVRGRDTVPATLIASRRAPDRSLFLLNASFLI